MSGDFLLFVSCAGGDIGTSHKKRYHPAVSLTFCFSEMSDKTAEYNQRILDLNKSMTLLAGPIKKLKLILVICRFSSLSVYGYKGIRYL